MAERRQLTSCVIDDLLIGIDVTAVQEVTGRSELAPVPHAPAFVSGLLNLRGQVVTAIDLRRCLAARERPPEERPVNVILRTDDGCVSLLVDRIGDVLEVDDQDVEAPPETLRGPVRDLITGVCQLDGGLLLVLDVEAVLASSASEQT